MHKRDQINPETYQLDDHSARYRSSNTEKSQMPTIVEFRDGHPNPSISVQKGLGESTTKQYFSNDLQHNSKPILEVNLEEFLTKLDLKRAQQSQEKLLAKGNLFVHDYSTADTGKTNFTSKDHPESVLSRLEGKIDRLLQVIEVKDGGSTPLFQKLSKTGLGSSVSTTLQVSPRNTNKYQSTIRKLEQVIKSLRNTNLSHKNEINSMKQSYEKLKAKNKKGSIEFNKLAKAYAKLDEKYQELVKNHCFYKKIDDFKHLKHFLYQLGQIPTPSQNEDSNDVGNTNPSSNGLNQSKDDKPSVFHWLATLGDHEQAMKIQAKLEKENLKLRRALNDKVEQLEQSLLDMKKVRGQLKESKEKGYSSKLYQKEVRDSELAEQVKTLNRQLSDLRIQNNQLQVDLDAKNLEAKVNPFKKDNDMLKKKVSELSQKLVDQGVDAEKAILGSKNLKEKFDDLQRNYDKAAQTIEDLRNELQQERSAKEKVQQSIALNQSKKFSHPVTCSSSHLSANNSMKAINNLFISLGLFF